MPTPEEPDSIIDCGRAWYGGWEMKLCRRFKRWRNCNRQSLSPEGEIWGEVEARVSGVDIVFR